MNFHPAIRSKGFSLALLTLFSRAAAASRRWSQSLAATGRSTFFALLVFAASMTAASSADALYLHDCRQPDAGTPGLIVYTYVPAETQSVTGKNLAQNASVKGNAVTLDIDIGVTCEWWLVFGSWSGQAVYPSYRASIKVNGVDYGNYTINAYYVVNPPQGGGPTHWHLNVTVYMPDAPNPNYVGSYTLGFSTLRADLVTYDEYPLGTVLTYCGQCLAAPTVSSIYPSFGPPTGGQAVTITGSGFNSLATPGVTIGGTNATNVQKVNATTLTAITPAHTLGSSINVSVSTVAGVSAANGLYTYTNDTSPLIVSANGFTTARGRAPGFTVQATGYPAPTFSNTSPPGNIVLHDNGDGSATFTGSSTVTGAFQIDICASNRVGQHCQLPFYINIVDAPPTVISPSSVTVLLGQPTSFVFQTTGSLPMQISYENVPAGLIPHDNGDGSAYFTGAPTVLGPQQMRFCASNDYGQACPFFTFNVVDCIQCAAPVVTSDLGFTLESGKPATFVFRASGSPPPVITYESPPVGIGVTDNGDGTASFYGSSLELGVHQMRFCATNRLGQVCPFFNVVITVAPQTVAFTSAPPSGPGVGGTYTPTALASSGLAPIITVDATSAMVCTISSGVVSFNSMGSCILNANQPGDNNFLSAPQVQQTLNIGIGSQNINFGAQSTQTFAGSGVTFALNPLATASSGLPVTYSSTTAGVCTVDANTGVVMIVSAGSCSIAADQAGSTNFAAAPQVTQTIIINPGPMLNIDNSAANGQYDAATDGVLLLRYLLGYRDAVLVNGALGSGPALRNAAEIATHISVNLASFDVDGDGKTLAMTDGLMIIRRLLGLSGSAVTANAKQGNRLDSDVEIAIDRLKP